MKKLLLIFSLLIIMGVSIKAIDIKTSTSYDGTNINIGNSITAENWSISSIKGANNEAEYYSLTLKNKQMIEINDGMYYVINYSGQYDTDRVNNQNTFVKINGNIKFAKYISSNMFLNLYIDTDYKNFVASEYGEYAAIASKAEVKFPKNNMTLNVKADCKYFVKKVKQIREEKTITDQLDDKGNFIITTSSAIVYTRRVDKGLEVTLSKEISDTVYFELYTSYGETNNKTKYGDTDYTTLSTPDLANEGMSVTYGYLSWNAYNGNIGSITLYGMYEKDIYTSDMVYIDTVTNGIVYGKGGIKWLGEVGVTGSYEYMYGGYSVSSYIKKSF